MTSQRTTQSLTTQSDSSRAAQPNGVLRKPGHPILQLQNTIGNRAVQRMVQPGSAASCSKGALVQRDGSGVTTIPEITIVGDPKAGAAYNAGLADGQSGAPSNPIDRAGFQYATDYMDGYNDGKSGAKQDNSNQQNAEPYNGPSIGPDPGTGVPVPECSSLEEYLGLCHEKNYNPRLDPEQNPHTDPEPPEIEFGE